MRPAVLAVPAMLLLAACAGGSEPEESCGTERVATLPALPADGYLAIPAALGDTRVSMLIDTGSQTSMIADGQQERLRLERDPHRYSNVYGVGGTHVRADHVLVPSLRFGERATGQLSLPIGTLPDRLEQLDPPIAGLIGLDVLRSFDIDIDRPHGVVSFYLATGCDSAAPAWTGPADRLDIFRATNGQLITPVLLDGVRVDAIIDTGAQRSVISDQTVARLGLNAAAFANDPATGMSGIDQVTKHGHLHRFAAVQIGHTVFRDVKLDVGSVHLPIGEMLLGEDFFRTHRFWLSASSEAAFIALSRR